MDSSKVLIPNNRVEIDLAALRWNYRHILTRVGEGVRVLTVVKSDGYGHGLVPVAKALAAEGAGTFGVAEVGEGVALRQAGIAGEIVVLLGVLPDAFPALVEFDLQTVVYDLDGLTALSLFAEQQGRQIEVHLKIDTGMGRLGIMPGQLDRYLELLGKLSGVRLVGILSHFPDADDLVDQTRVIAQNQRFSEILATVRQRCGKNIAHIANSAAILNLSDSHYDMVRPGITLYGCYPFPAGEARSSLQLKPVMSFKTRVIQVKEVPPGYGISYGHTFITKRPTRLAVLPVGYDDGYLRRLAGRAEVIITGQRVPVLGRICMNACLADITDLGPVRAGDEVVLLGRQGEAVITADDLAVWSETISYEILCLLGGSNHRVYLAE